MCEERDRLGRCYNIPVDVNGNTSCGVLCLLWVISFVRDKEGLEGADESVWWPGRQLQYREGIRDAGTPQLQREEIKHGSAECSRVQK